VNAPYPMLWFDGQAEPAAELYVSLFSNSSITRIERYPEDLPGEAGTVMTVDFELDGARVTALNGGPTHTLSPAFSFVVGCQDQAEIDELWDALIDGGGEASQCGWLVDRFGTSWQIIPEDIADLIKQPAAMEAMLAMQKLDVATLREAAGV